MARHFASLSNPELITMINEGCIGVIPTDTVYGLVAKADSQKAIEHIYAVKSRARQPGTTIAASTKQLLHLGFPEGQLRHAEKYWPNALSVEMSATGIPHYLSTGQPVMAARIPNNLELTTLLQATGPLMTTSANAQGQPTSNSVQMAIDYFGNEVDFYVNGGDLSGRPPSTIIGFHSDGKIIIYRQGAVTIEN